MILDIAASGVLGAALAITALLLVAALLAAAWRLFVGPNLADRIVALDMVSMVMVVFLVLFKLISGNNAYMYAAIALALIAFLATVAFANYLDRSRGDSDE
jgi:multisubunit Na+/H+ antiporter MnhF subunit